MAAEIMLPRLNVSGGILFMVDTGSDLTLLSPTDAMRLGCPGAGASLSRMYGWEGRMDVGLEQAVLAFRDIALKLYSINVGIVVENPVDRWPMPSVLGMDVLSRWRVTLEPREGVFEIEPKNADLDELKTDALANVLKQHGQRKNGVGHL